MGRKKDSVVPDGTGKDFGRWPQHSSAGLFSEEGLFSVVAAMVRAQVSLNLPKPVFDYIPGGLKRTGRMPVRLRLSIMFPGHMTRGWDVAKLRSSLTWARARSWRVLLVVGSSVENIRCDGLVAVLALRELRRPAQRRGVGIFRGP